MPTLRGTEIDGRYRLEEPVGQGGMATVWRARDLRLGRDVALKLIAEARFEEPGFVERFEREAQLAASLSHPNLVSIHDLGFHEGRPFLVMELIDGETLSRRIERAPETVDTIDLARSLLGVLAAIHERGIVHRDVKPANVLFEDGGRIRLTDFGIARAMGSSSITQTGEVIGTLKYMAPEVRDGEDPSPAADLYALGVLLAECGAGNGPLRDLVRKLRSPDIAKRPASARLALVSIAGVRAGLSETEAIPQRAPTEVLSKRPGARPVVPAGTPTGSAGESDASLPTAEPAPAAADHESADATGPAPRATGSPGGPSARPSGLLLKALGGAAALLVVVLVASAVLDGGDDASPEQSADPQREQRAANGDGQGRGQQAEEQAPAPAETAPAEDEGQATSEVAIDPARGRQLNDQGFALLQQGQPAEAVPILEQAVASFPEGSNDINYAYALFNLGTALRQAGRPDEAIPYLEQRLAWNDQRATVKTELRAARAEAG